MKVQQELTKLYYTIGEVAEMFDMNTSSLRFWETEFSQLKPKKSRRGDRQYTVKDIHTLERIYTLVKERGFTIDGARKEMRSKQENTTSLSKETIVQKLEGIKEGLVKLKGRV